MPRLVRRCDVKQAFQSTPASRIGPMLLYPHPRFDAKHRPASRIEPAQRQIVATPRTANAALVVEGRLDLGCVRNPWR